MTYQETVSYLYGMLPMYQKVGKSAFKKDLTNTTALLNALDNPHKKFKSVHIAGTNGKGTSAHTLSAILQTSGYKTGLYTSPHLLSFTERIKIDGQPVSEAFVVDFVQQLKPVIAAIEPSFFEVTVAMAFAYFAREQVDIAIVETGLGGRLDSTNVILPEVSLITNIGFDHMDMLGDTLPKIAGEKAGIIKKGRPAVVGEWHEETWPVFQEKAEQVGASLILAPTFLHQRNESDVQPEYLYKNLHGVVAVVHELTKRGFVVERRHIELGIQQMTALTGLKGRFQLLSRDPMTIADVSHNEDGLRILFKQLRSICKGTVHLIFGTVKDKPLQDIFSLFPEQALCYWTTSDVPRALPTWDLHRAALSFGIEGEMYEDVNLALKVAKKKALPNDLIIVTGSTFVVAEIKDL